MTKYLLYLTIFLFAASHGNAQDCRRFQLRKCKIKEAPGYIESSSRSKSAVLQLNEQYNFQSIFYGNKDYKLLVCADDSKNLTKIHVKIIHTENKKVIYDNAQNDYSPLIIFTVDNTVRLTLEVTLIGESTTNSAPEDNRICTAISVAYKKLPKMGF